MTYFKVDDKEELCGLLPDQFRDSWNDVGRQLNVTCDMYSERLLSKKYGRADSQGSEDMISSWPRGVSSEAPRGGHLNNCGLLRLSCVGRDKTE